MIGCDLDGTLIDYESYGKDAQTKVNENLLKTFIGEKIAIITNQGGIPLGYRSPARFTERLSVLAQACQDIGVEIVSCRIALYHQKASMASIMEASANLNQCMQEEISIETRVYTASQARKPSPMMLTLSRATVYYGDSDEDEQAAAVADIKFVRVERFV